jgi:transcriptional regulator with XRE-family HTH domain
MEENIIKQTCKELGINQRELAELTKFKEQTIRNWSSSNELPEYAKAFFEVLIKSNYQSKAIKSFKEFTAHLQKI